MKRKITIVISLSVVSCLIGVVMGLITRNNTLINKQRELIDLQATLIDDMANHCWEQHDCDVPYMDGYVTDSIHILERQLNILDR